MRLKSTLTVLIVMLAGLSGLSGAMAETRVQPLTPDELAAVVQEADARSYAIHGVHPPQSIPPWHVVTPDTLRRLLDSRQIQQIGFLRGQGELLDQAMAWDLVHFQNLTDIKRFFQQVYGDQFFREPPATARDAFGPGIGYYTEASATAEAGAFSALYNCLPSAVWSIESTDPMLWMMQRGNNLDVPNADDFRKCVRKQRDGAHTPYGDEPDSPRGIASAAIIEDRLSRQLLAHGCRASGPDHCLFLLRSLVALDNRHPALPRILKRLDKEVGASSPPQWPDVFPGAEKMSQAEQSAFYDRLEADLRQWGIVLSAELDNMQVAPAAWSKRQRRRAVDAAITLMLNGRRADWQVHSMGWHNSREYGIENPWQHLGDELHRAPDIEARLLVLGKDAAAVPGCGRAAFRREQQPQEFWLGYAERKLRTEQKDCRALPVEWIVQRYIAAGTAQELAASPIAFLGKWVVANDTPTGQAIRTELADQCPETDFGGDAWGICGERAAQAAAERASAEAEREAAEAAERAVANDPCQNGVYSALMSDLGYGDDDGYANGGVQADCSVSADGTGVAAVAFLHVAPVASGDDQDGEDGDYDLDLLLVGKDGKRLARGQFHKVAYSDAVRLENVMVARQSFDLAANKPAYAVVSVNSAHCYQCNYEERTLSLYVREGSRLRQVLRDFAVGGTQSADAPSPPGCEGATVSTERALAPGANSHHGLADLQVTVTTVNDNGYKSDADVACPVTGGREVHEEVWRYDGKRYRIFKP